MDRQVRPALEPILAAHRERPLLVGTGGTVAILARMEMASDEYDRARIEATPLSAATVTRWVDCLWSRPLAERRQTIGLPGNRADVILMGAVIYEAVLRQLGFSVLRVSTRGMRFAAVMQPQEEPLPLVGQGQA